MTPHKAVTTMEPKTYTAPKTNNASDAHADSTEVQRERLNERIPGNPVLPFVQYPSGVLFWVEGKGERELRKGRVFGGKGVYKDERRKSYRRLRRKIR